MLLCVVCRVVACPLAKQKCCHGKKEKRKKERQTYL